VTGSRVGPGTSRILSRIANSSKETFDGEGKGGRGEMAKQTYYGDSKLWRALDANGIRALK
jgi:hypothetical protein